MAGVALPSHAGGGDGLAKRRLRETLLGRERIMFSCSRGIDPCKWKWLRCYFLTSFNRLSPNPAATARAARFDGFVRCVESCEYVLAPVAKVV